jgi:hypothetical protein
MNERRKFKHFQFWGIFFGGILPVLMFGACGYTTGIVGVSVVKWAPASIAVPTVLIVILSFVLSFCEEDHGETKWFSGLFKIQAFLCFFLVHLVVRCTGGSRGSVFAFTCLYVPSVVGYVYGKKGPNFIGASFVMLTIYVINLFKPQDLSSTPPDHIINLATSSLGLPSIRVEYFYLGVFLLQLIALAFMAAQKPQLKDADPQP